MSDFKSDFKSDIGSFYPAELSDSLTRFCASGWPPFIWNDPAMQFAWPQWFRNFPEYQYEFRDGSGRRLACVHTVPLRWDESWSNLPDGLNLTDDSPVPDWNAWGGDFDGFFSDCPKLGGALSGWDWVIAQSLQDFQAGRSPNVLSAAATVVSSNARGQGLAGESIKWMKEIARAHGLKYVIAPLRPSRKRDFPNMDFTQYCQKRQVRDNGQVLPFDPWLRLHVKLGGRLIKPCFRSIRIRQPISVWRDWLEIDEIPVNSGRLTIPDADSLLEIDETAGIGYYSASGVWAIHNV